MDYLKSLGIAFGAIALMFLFWAFALGGGPFYGLRPFHGDGAHLLFSLGLLAVAGGIFALVKDSYPVVGMGMVFGAACGAATALAVWFGSAVLEDARGFWVCLLLWFVCVFIFGAACGAFSYAVKSMIVAVFRLDFLTVLLGLIVGVSAFFMGMAVLVGAFQCHVLMGIGVLLGISGGVAGIKGEALSSDVVMDEVGNMHFVSSRNGDSSITTTDGERMRMMPDGTAREF
ncbi:hypothetical protein [uncultured Muribaculum sp.]|uniref:hypothetical protein n=1 Tax=uncultured Muribaculum sp. TaxID=1918613 RepID=UPI0026385C66|nr:hypothetical protein [uncultured Muribaculum sp.]